jgi:hypothetical protein
VFVIEKSSFIGISAFASSTTKLDYAHTERHHEEFISGHICICSNCTITVALLLIVCAHGIMKNMNLSHSESMLKNMNLAHSESMLKNMNLSHSESMLKNMNLAHSESMLKNMNLAHSESMLKNMNLSHSESMLKNFKTNILLTSFFFFACSQGHYEDYQPVTRRPCRGTSERI